MSKAQHTVYLYLAQESELEIDIDAALEALPDYSKEKIQRKQTAALRSSAIKAHALMDWCLRKHRFQEGESYRLRETAHGKPIACFEDQTFASFNLSHSHGRIAFACADTQMAIGVDCEASKKDNFLKIADRYFTAEESGSLRKIQDVAESREAFTRIWTRKEAWVKMLGLGIQKPLSSFRVSTQASPNRWILEDSEIEDLSPYSTFDAHFTDNTPVAISTDQPTQILRLHVRARDGQFIAQID
ncbi:MAG: 4'-phosphopantetheinyl transferase family protein [Opitutales bacterium]